MTAAWRLVDRPHIYSCKTNHVALNAISINDSICWGNEADLSLCQSRGHAESSASSGVYRALSVAPLWIGLFMLLLFLTWKEVFGRFDKLRPIRFKTQIYKVWPGGQMWHNKEFAADHFWIDYIITALISAVRGALVHVVLDLQCCVVMSQCSIILMYLCTVKYVSSTYPNANPGARY